MRFFGGTCVCLLATLCVRPALAQDREFSPWQPMGPVPVDQAGAGRRGYSLPGESADVAAPQTHSVAFHMVGANNFYVEQSGGFDISQRSETHTLAFEYRRGFKAGRWPRFEIGAQLQVSETDAGMLNGFISGFEDFVHAPLRSRTATLPPLGTYIMRDGRAIYQTPGSGAGPGDIYVVAKAALRDADPASRATRVAARLAVNVSGSSAFSEGNFAGAGVSAGRKISEWLALYGDVRATVPLDSASTWGLPLARGALGFSAGSELRLTANTSMNLQYEGNTSPYLPTGSTGIDAGYGGAVFGLSHRFTARRRIVVAQFYARENMVLPFNVRWNTDPDLAIGLKARIY